MPQRRIDIALLRRLAALGLTGKEIAARMGFTADAVRDCALRHGIPCPTSRRNIDEGELRRLAAEGLTTRRIARRLEFTDDAIRRVATRCGIPIDVCLHATRVAYWAVNQDWLEDLVAEGLTASQIGDQMGLTKGAVMGRLRRTQLRLARPQ